MALSIIGLNTVMLSITFFIVMLSAIIVSAITLSVFYTAMRLTQHNYTKTQHSMHSV
jgi:hypothetical protein